MTRIVILGTGTNVGKTYAAVALTEAITTHLPAVDVLALKPIETGVAPDSHRNLTGEAVESDAQKLARACQAEPFDDLHAYAFPDPVSPHLAAIELGQEINVGRAAAWVTNAEHKHRHLGAHKPTLRTNCIPHWTIVETAGGAFSPLAPNKTNIDLARCLEPAIWILIAPDRLGVLHELTATLIAMRATSRPPDHVLLSQGPSIDRSTGTNAHEIERLGLAEIAETISPAGTLSQHFIQRLLAGMPSPTLNPLRWTR